jgi:hypothetical protein
MKKEITIKSSKRDPGVTVPVMWTEEKAGEEYDDPDATAYSAMITFRGTQVSGSGWDPDDAIMDVVFKLARSGFVVKGFEQNVRFK